MTAKIQTRKNSRIFLSKDLRTITNKNIFDFGDFGAESIHDSLDNAVAEKSRLSLNRFIS